MCYFVTVELPAELAELPAGLVLRECRHALHPRRGGRLVEVTDGHCSCDFVRGHGDDEERLATRYRKQGWSAARIARALEGYRAAAGRRCDKAAVFESWLAELATGHGSVPVFVHWASAPLDPAAGHAAVPIAELGKGPLPTEAWFDLVAAN